MSGRHEAAALRCLLLVTVLTAFLCLASSTASEPGVAPLAWGVRTVAVSSDSSSTKANVIDNNSTTSWQSGACFPTGFIGNSAMNALLNATTRLQLVATNGSQHLDKSFDGNFYTGGYVAAVGGVASLSIILTAPTDIYRFYFRGSWNKGSARLSVTLEDGSPVIIADNMNSNTTWADQKVQGLWSGVTHILLVSNDSFTLTELAAQSARCMEWAVLDMQSEYSFNLLRARWSSPDALSTSLMSSVDGTTWIKIRDLNSSTLASADLWFDPPIQARYIQIKHVVHEDDWKRVYVWELAAYSKLEAYQQCGGLSGDCSGSSTKSCVDAQYPGWSCPAGWSCIRSNSFYWQCAPSSAATSTSPVATTSPSPAVPSPSPSPSSTTSSNLTQCGGTGNGCSNSTGSNKPCGDAVWTGTACASGYTCTRLTAASWWCMQQSSNNTNANTSVVPGPGNVTNSTATGASSPSAPDGCVAVAGMSTGANSTTWWPYVLKQLFNGSAEAQMPIGAPLYGSSGSYGAAVTINNASRKAWHVQLSSQPAWMGRGDYYAVKFAARSSATTVLQVAVVEDSTWQLLYLSQLRVTTGVSLYTIFDIVPFATSSYLLNFDLGLADVGAAVTLDDILVCKQSGNMLATTDGHGSRLVAAASTDFEGASNYWVQVVAPANASSTLQSSAAAAPGGQYGASILVNQPGLETWHIQLVGQAVLLNATKSYTTRLALKHSTPDNVALGSNKVKVTWIQHQTYVAVFVYTLVPTTGYQTYILPPMSPPTDDQYYMTIDFGSVVAGTTVYVDDINVFEA